MFKYLPDLNKANNDPLLELYIDKQNINDFITFNDTVKQYGLTSSIKEYALQHTFLRDTVISNEGFMDKTKEVLSKIFKFMKAMFKKIIDFISNMFRDTWKNRSNVELKKYPTEGIKVKFISKKTFSDFCSGAATVGKNANAIFDTYTTFLDEIDKLLPKLKKNDKDSKTLLINLSEKYIKISDNLNKELAKANVNNTAFRLEFSQTKVSFQISKNLIDESLKDMSLKELGWNCSNLAEFNNEIDNLFGPFKKHFAPCENTLENLIEKCDKTYDNLKGIEDTNIIVSVLDLLNRDFDYIYEAFLNISTLTIKIGGNVSRVCEIIEK